VLGTQPSLELAYQGLGPLLPNRQALRGGEPVDLALDREQLVDAPHRLGRDRRLADRGQLEQLATRVHHPNAIERLRFTTTMSFAGQGFARPRRPRRPT